MTEEPPVSEAPLLLAFDASTPLASVAVGRGDELLAQAYLVDPREQASRLVPTISAVLREAGVDRAQLGGIIVGKGAGSFTGVRIAAATARGLAAGLGVPVWPCSSLAAAAVSAWVPAGLRGHLSWRFGSDAPLEADPAAGVGAPLSSLPSAARDGPRYILFDAGGDRVYAAAYRFSDGGIQTVLEPCAATVGELLRLELAPDALFAGDGALRHVRTLEAAGHSVLAFPAGVPTAAALLGLHRLRPVEAPEREGSRWQPDYLRGSSARPPRRMEGMS
ncbi:MAG: tRNA (adenosine(37)-N6)-threonylcarbamoyltransferase complex dimerization subunit type 1 TsaB [Gemmatimonadetes bacterium]|nr:tRNA (adenosine(37)-N6)-threonylcarbamoyltransferase complex dimerization subunit type 1 TsaB [Gemmatimonadota bacterium]